MVITRIHDSLLFFPDGNKSSKFLDLEIVGLIEWSLPLTWRSKFDLDGYIHTLDTKAKLIVECKAIEQNKGDRRGKKEKNNNNKKTKKESCRFGSRTKKYSI